MGLRAYIPSFFYFLSYSPITVSVNIRTSCFDYWYISTAHHRWMTLLNNDSVEPRIFIWQLWLLCPPISLSHGRSWDESEGIEETCYQNEKRPLPIMKSRYFVVVSAEWPLSPQTGGDTNWGCCRGNQVSGAFNPSWSSQFGLRGKGRVRLSTNMQAWTDIQVLGQLHTARH